MKWKQPPSKRIQPPKGSYSEWKTEIAEACAHQCVYCAISESSYGGIQNFHVEHYRPKSKHPKLREVISNLYLACGICNRFKSDDWPAEPDEKHSIPSYPDPTAHDFNTLFLIDSKNFYVSGKHVATRYVTERLFLNRAQLVRERRLVAVEAHLQATEDEFLLIKAIAKTKDDKKLVEDCLELSELIVGANQLYRKAMAASPYSLFEVTRSPQVKSKKASRKLRKR